MHYFYSLTTVITLTQINLVHFTTVKNTNAYESDNCVSLVEQILLPVCIKILVLMC